MSNEIEILSHQLEFLNSKATHTGLVAGFGAGKSKAGTFKTIEKKKMYPNINVAYYLPTYNLIRDIAFSNFSETLTDLGVPFQLNKIDKEFITPLGKIILRSMSDPDLIIGYEVGYSLIDEADILPKKKMQDVFVKIVARNRKKLPNNDINCIDLVSTPEGFNFMYDFFIKNNKANRYLIRAKTKNNPYLPESYIDTLNDIYTSEQLEAYLNGEFINLNSGNVYRNFDRQLNHSNRTIEERDVLHIGMDFNITNMSAVIHVVDKIPIAVEEIIGVYDTFEMINTIKERYPNHRIVIYPDASGKNRKTSGKSDIKLLKEARFITRNLSKNPFVRDRVNAVNMAFLNNKGERKYLINTNNCPVYTEALEQQAYRNGEPDKLGGFDHVNEAGGYFIYSQNQNKRARILV